MNTRIFFLFLIFLFYTSVMEGQNSRRLSATVIDDKDSIALSYVNVMLYSLDSVFLNGSITNGQGVFSIENNDRQGYYLKLSSIGYRIRKIPLSQLNDSIFLQQDTNVLSEVVVKGNRNYVKPTLRGISVSMKNNPVASLGTAFDVLKQMPLIDGSTGTLNVLGKGTPEVYINNKLVHDQSELSRLSANEIENIEIITNPGAKYAANVSSVIIIKTKIKESGLGGETMISGKMSEVWSSQVNINLVYKQKNGLSYFIGTDYANDGFKQKRTYNEIFNEDRFFTTTRGDYKSRANTVTASIGSNYDFKENSVGGRYEFSRVPNRTYTANSNITTNVNAQTDKMISLNSDNSHSYRHYLNTYLIFKMGTNRILYADMDYISGNAKSNSIANEYMKETIASSIKMSNENSYSLGACKLNLNTSLWGGTMDIGGQYSYTENRQQFLTSSNRENELLQPAIDKEYQNFGAIYLSYQHKINDNFNYYGGIRYEMTDFSYRQNGKLIEDQSKKYVDVLPNIGINFQKKNYSIDLYYKTTISRPDYQSLNNNYVYVSHTLWEIGNPFLRSSLRQNVGFNFSWKRLILSAVYSRNKRSIYSIYEYEEDAKINIRQDINLPDFNAYTLTAYTNLDFGVWHPMIQGLVQFQNLKYGNPSESYSKPICQLYLSNRFDLPYKIYLYTNGLWVSKGHDKTAYSEGAAMMNVSLNRTFNNWTFNLQASDVLNTWRQKNKLNTNGVFYNYDIKGGSRSVLLSVSYLFNGKRKTYKGTGAVKDEIDRL